MTEATTPLTRAELLSGIRRGLRQHGHGFGIVQADLSLLLRNGIAYAGKTSWTGAHPARVKGVVASVMLLMAGSRYPSSVL